MIIDLDHLDRATAGDVTLRQDLLILFRDQLLDAAGSVDTASDGGPDLSTAMLHRLRGSAEAIGAKALARDLSLVEASHEAAAVPGGRDAVVRLGLALRQTVDAAEQLIAAHERRGLAKNGESG